jgi:hypothetical protein
MATSSLSELNARRHFATVTLAQLAARNAVKRQIQREGRVKPWWLVTPAQIARQADDYLAAHPELYVQAAASPIVQNLRITNRKRRARNQPLPLCRSHERNGGGSE